jgi:glycerol-3-phosphate dehydrogenase
VVYHDLQFDDARFALELARAAADRGAVVMNYARAEGFLEGDGRVHGARVRDLEHDEAFEVEARVVINAGGIYADAIRRLRRPAAPSLLRLSRGAHVVLERSFLPGDTAVLVPRTDDGRVVFLIPWRGRVLVGTTDTPVSSPDLEPFAAREDVDFLLDHASRYLARTPTRLDVRSAFAGLRPLPARGGATTSRLRRDHRVEAADGVVTIAGGKWTTYRLMAAEAVDAAVRAAHLRAGASGTRELSLARRPEDAGDAFEARVVAGGVARGLSADDRRAIEWMAHEEMARRVEDVLARRTRALFLDARAAGACARGVAQALGAALGRDGAWVDAQAQDFAALAAHYLPA